VLFGAGLGVLAVALLSPVATYGHALLSAHMVQHLLLVLVAAPLLVAARPIPALLAVLPEGARRSVMAAGRSRLARLATHPLVAWLAFAATGWAVHFSPLFDQALQHPVVHAAEHGLFLGSGLLFWQPVLADGPRALSYPLRLLYLGLAMPQNTFLALAILSADHPLYDAYVRLGRTWGPSVLDDQRQGAGLMWVAGDLTLLVAVLAVAGAWAGHDRDQELPDDDEGAEAAEAAEAAEVSGGSAGPPPSPRRAG
jgi:cytochrome c oxidase assembly factor CtaG